MNLPLEIVHHILNFLPDEDRINLYKSGQPLLLPIKLRRNVWNRQDLESLTGLTNPTEIYRIKTLRTDEVPEDYDRNHIKRIIPETVTVGQRSISSLDTEIEISIIAECSDLLRQLPSFYLITDLKLIQCQLESVPSELQHLKNLRELNLSLNQITEIKNLPPNLKSLDISYNRVIDLTSIKESNIISLDCSFNPIEIVPDNLKLFCLRWEIMENVPSQLWTITTLKFLSLDECELTEFPMEILQLISLQYLSVRYNRLSTLPDELQTLPLNCLVLQGNPFRTIPEVVWKLTTLTYLNLNHIGLTELSSEIGNLINLTDINLNRNRLTKLPIEIGKLRKLQFLKLSINDLTELPDLSETNLQELWVVNNSLTSIPEIPTLKKLYVDNNRLTSIPSSYCNLEKLSVTGNPGLILPSEFAKFS